MPEIKFLTLQYVSFSSSESIPLSCVSADLKINIDLFIFTTVLLQ